MNYNYNKKERERRYWIQTVNKNKHPVALADKSSNEAENVTPVKSSLHASKKSADLEYIEEKKSNKYSNVILTAGMTHSLFVNTLPDCEGLNSPVTL